MVHVAVILAPGFEEIEAITPIDVLRRAGFEVTVLGFEAQVTGSHAITVKADALWDGDLTPYDLVVLPGGLPGANHLRDDEGLISALQVAHQSGKYLAAICAAPKVLGQAGLLDNRTYTCYPGVEAEIGTGTYQPELLVQDGQIITSRGAGTSLAFAYHLVDVLGGDSAALAKGMMYQELIDSK